MCGLSVIVVIIAACCVRHKLLTSLRNVICIEHGSRVCVTRVRVFMLYLFKYYALTLFYSRRFANAHEIKEITIHVKSAEIPMFFHLPNDTVGVLHGVMLHFHEI